MERETMPKKEISYKDLITREAVPGIKIVGSLSPEYEAKADEINEKIRKDRQERFRLANEAKDEILYK